MPGPRGLNASLPKSIPFCWRPPVPHFPVTVLRTRPRPVCLAEACVRVLQRDEGCGMHLVAPSCPSGQPLAHLCRTPCPRNHRRPRAGCETGTGGPRSSPSGAGNRGASTHEGRPSLLPGPWLSNTPMPSAGWTGTQGDRLINPLSFAGSRQPVNPAPPRQHPRHTWYLGSLGCTATATSPSIVSIRVVATTTSSSLSGVTGDLMISALVPSCPPPHPAQDPGDPLAPT